MWTIIATLLSTVLKFVFESIAKRKLNDEEFLQHIEAHQKRRQNAGKMANDFESAMAEAAAAAETAAESKETKEG